MTQNQLALKVQQIVQAETRRRITVKGVKIALNRHLLRVRADLRNRLGGYEGGTLPYWRSMKNERKRELVDELAQIIMASDSRYRRNHWSIPSIDQEGLSWKETYQTLEGHLEQSYESQVKLVGEVKLLSSLVLLRRLIKLSEMEPDIVSYDRSSKVGVIQDLDAVMPHLIAMNNPNCRCSLYVNSFPDGPWAGFLYVGITELLPKYRNSLHLTDAFREDKDTGEYRRHHRFAQAIRETAAFRRDYTSAPFDTEIIDSDLNSKEASKLEIELIERYKQTDPERLLNEKGGGSIGGRFGTKIVLLDGAPMCRSAAIRQFCLEEGIDDEERVTANLNPHCKQHPQYQSASPIELRPLLIKAAHLIKHGTKAYSKGAFEYQYLGELRCLREIADITGYELTRLRTLRERAKLKPGDVIDDYVDGKKTDQGCCAAPDPKAFFEYLKSRDPLLAQRWVEKSIRRGLSWRGLAMVRNDSPSTVQNRARSHKDDIPKFWTSMGVRLDDA